MATEVKATTQLEIVVNRKELTAELAAAVGVVERHTTIPILSNLLIDATGEGALQSVKLSATDLSQGLTTSVPARIKAPGVVTVPARKLYDYVRLLAGDDVTIKQEENSWLKIKCGRSNTRMIGMSAASFPQLPQPTDWKAGLEADIFRAFIAKALVTVADAEGKYAINAALLEIAGSRVAMISTDGNRLTRVSKTDCSVAGASTWRALIPRKALQELASILRDEAISLIEIGETDNALFFRAGVRTLSSQKLAGQFPSYEAIIPSNSGAPLELDVETVSQSLSRCLLFSEAKTRLLALDISAGTLEMKSAGELGETAEQLDIIGGPAETFAIGFDGDFIKEFLAAVEGHVEFHFSNNAKPALFVHRTDNGITHEYVCAPMRRGDK
jgi:DNA polymerase-3 subunit beta